MKITILVVNSFTLLSFLSIVIFSTFYHVYVMSTSKNRKLRVDVPLEEVIKSFSIIGKRIKLQVIVKSYKKISTSSEPQEIGKRKQGRAGIELRKWNQGNCNVLHYQRSCPSVYAWRSDA